MRYKIASNSKQLTAAAILVLAERHKLSLDDNVARFLPDDAKTVGDSGSSQDAVLARLVLKLIA